MVSGPLSHEQNLQEILHSYTEIQEARLAGIITDEAGDSALLDRQIEGILATALNGESRRENRSCTFRKIGGFKVFRDDVYSGLKIIFRQDHRTYRKTGRYDFPQKNALRRLFVNLGYLITGLPFIQRKMVENMPMNMIRQYKKLYAKD